MEWVARVLYARSLESGRGFAQVPSAWRADVSPGLELSAARRAGAVGQVWGARAGYVVAERLFAAFSAIEGTDVLRAVMALSCQLNVSDIDEEKRNALVRKLARALPPVGHRQEPRGRSVGELLRRWLRGQDAGLFLSGVQEL